MARYRHEMEAGLRGSVVKSYTLALGPIEQRAGEDYQWILLRDESQREQFRVWLLSAGYPPQTLEAAQRTTAQYILQENNSEPAEFRDRFTGKRSCPRWAVGNICCLELPGRRRRSARRDLRDRPITWASLSARRGGRGGVRAAAPSAKLIELLPDVLIGVPSNTRQKDDTRRYDNSDYELVRLTRTITARWPGRDYCVRVDAGQLQWMDGLNVFYWGVGGSDVHIGMSLPQLLPRTGFVPG